MILVVGGTGDLGGRIVRRLVTAGEPVRCLVRTTADPAPLRTLGVETVVGDLTDPWSLRRACEGVDVVVASATVLTRRLAGARRPTIREADEAGMASLVGAAEAAGVRRFVYVSFAGADQMLGTPLERAKMATERRLAASPMRRVVVRPDAFQEIHLGPPGRFDVAAGRVAVVGKGDTRRRWVATDDVAALVAAVVSEPDPPELIEFGGPELLSRNEAVAVAERVTGRRFTVRHMPVSLARVGMALLRPFNDALASVFGAGVLQDRAGSTWDDAPLVARGITPRSVTDWIRQQAAGGQRGE
ncbi:NADH dehydrogenase [Georgenia soli]|uniref:NADH dehydrogenase n=2 Tax=Georgenia soli TaxID=638953 RepID=A0A2A9ES49_9MICO|nr:NADH dehydrogenase [Georgenia soli]